jgi:hypothetical protein
VGRAVVLCRGQPRDEDEQHHLPRRLGVRARPATRAKDDDKEGDAIAPH